MINLRRKVKVKKQWCKIKIILNSGDENGPWTYLNYVFAHAVSYCSFVKKEKKEKEKKGTEGLGDRSVGKAGAISLLACMAFLRPTRCGRTDCHPVPSDLHMNTLVPTHGSTHTKLFFLKKKLQNLELCKGWYINTFLIIWIFLFNIYRKFE